MASYGTYYIRVYYFNNGNSYDLWWDDIGDDTPPPPPSPENYIKLSLSPAGSEKVRLSYTCNVSHYAYAGVPVNVYLAAAQNCTINEGPRGVDDYLDMANGLGSLNIFGSGLNFQQFG